VLASSAVLGLAVSFVLPFLSMFGTLEAKMSLPVFGAFMTVSALGSIVLSTALAQRSDLLSSRRSMLLLGSGSGALGYLGAAHAVKDRGGQFVNRVPGPIDLEQGVFEARREDLVADTEDF
jgi:hypothetical protein